MQTIGGNFSSGAYENTKNTRGFKRYFYTTPNGTSAYSYSCKINASSVSATYLGTISIGNVYSCEFGGLNVQRTYSMTINDLQFTNSLTLEVETENLFYRDPNFFTEIGYVFDYESLSLTLFYGYNDDSFNGDIASFTVNGMLKSSEYFDGSFTHDLSIVPGGTYSYSVFDYTEGIRSAEYTTSAAICTDVFGDSSFFGDISIIPFAELYNNGNVYSFSSRAEPPSFYPASETVLLTKDSSIVRSFNIDPQNGTEYGFSENPPFTLTFLHTSACGLSETSVVIDSVVIPETGPSNPKVTFRFGNTVSLTSSPSDPASTIYGFSSTRYFVTAPLIDDQFSYGFSETDLVYAFESKSSSFILSDEPLYIPCLPPVFSTNSLRLSDFSSIGLSISYDVGNMSSSFFFRETIDATPYFFQNDPRLITGRAQQSSYFPFTDFPEYTDPPNNVTVTIEGSNTCGYASLSKIIPYDCVPPGQFAPTDLILSNFSPIGFFLSLTANVSGTDILYFASLSSDQSPPTGQQLPQTSLYTYVNFSQIGFVNPNAFTFTAYAANSCGISSITKTVGAAPSPSPSTSSSLLKEIMTLVLLYGIALIFIRVLQF